MHEVVIRAAGPPDVRTVLELVRELARFEDLSHAVMCGERDLHDALFGQPPSLHAVLALEGKRAAGLATYYFAFSSFRGRKLLYLEDLFVAKCARKQGIGRRMMAHVASCAKAAGCAGMRWMVLDWNKQAVNFYKSLGSVHDATWHPCSLTGAAFDALAEGAGKGLRVGDEQG